jgi:D-alanyl-D-alanine carboxypeptidase/D-alanyl-D-alanine-endopeptidase (penicillin-binding protein 4)
MKLLRIVVPALVAGACATAGGAPATALPPSSRAAFRHAIDSMVSQREFRDAHFGVLIVNPRNGDTLYSLNAGKLFMPASNMKVITSTTALVQLGPDYTYRTDFAATGPIVHDTLQGALIVTGRGDPTISDHMRGSAMKPLLDVADSLHTHGVVAITGGILAGPDGFPDTTIGYGWSWEDFSEDYGAGIDALYLNEGFSEVYAYGRPGRQPDSIVTSPARTYPVIAIAPAVGGGADTSELHLDFDSLRTKFFARGRMKNAVDTLIAVYPSQRDAYLAGLREALVSRGIHVGTSRSYAASSSAPAATPLFTVHSPPMRQILPALLKPSQNQIAELLFKTLGLEKTGVGSADSGQAVLERQLIAFGAEPDGFLIRDGSGLSRYDYLSPETLVRVLNRVRSDSAFHVFYDALPIAGVDGSLRRRVKGTSAQGRIHAKTGSISNARSLSGYAITADSDTLIFSLLANNWITREQAVDSVHNRIMVLMASLNLRDLK